MNFEVDQDHVEDNTPFGGLVPSRKTPVKSILLTWYLLISFGNAQHSGGKVEDATEISRYIPLIYPGIYSRGKYLPTPALSSDNLIGRRVDHNDDNPNYSGNWLP